MASYCLTAVGKIVGEGKDVTISLLRRNSIMDPKTYAQGAMLIWETQEHFDAYLKSDEYKTTVLDICEGEPSIEVYVHTANLTDGVLL
jgi:hypothetical protein